VVTEKKVADIGASVPKKGRELVAIGFARIKPVSAFSVYK
jgi:hypothetical protein